MGGLSGGYYRTECDLQRIRHYLIDSWIDNIKFLEIGKVLQDLLAKDFNLICTTLPYLNELSVGAK